MQQFFACWQQILIYGHLSARSYMNIWKVYKAIFCLLTDKKSIYGLHTYLVSFTSWDRKLNFHLRAGS